MIRTVDIIGSKSFAHRAYICAMLAAEGRGLGADAVFDAVECTLDSDDVEATRGCVKAIAERGSRNDGPLELNAGESGSTLRFLIPVLAALGIEAYIKTRGRLYERPMEDLSRALECHGAKAERAEGRRIHVSGKLAPGDFRLPGDISSQYVTGVLMALPIIGGGSITLTSRLKSGAYVDMTMEVMRAFGVEVTKTEKGFSVPEGSGYTLPERYKVEGDWSQASFFLVAGAVGDSPVAVRGLRADSVQGDRAIVNVIEKFGGRVEPGPEGAFVSKPSALKSASVDIDPIPDLAPPIAVLAAAAGGLSKLRNCGRLRLKESDRVESIVKLLCDLGAGAYSSDDEIMITGIGSGREEGLLLPGGEADAAGDHRIAMAAAVMSLITSGKVEIKGSGAVSKSYPGFFDELEGIGLSDNIVLK